MNIDRDHIAAELGFKRSDIDMLLDMFHKNANTSLVEMQKMIDEKDMQGIADTSHAISGSAGTMRLDDIHKLAMSIELAAKKGENIDYHLYYQQLKTLHDLF